MYIVCVCVCVCVRACTCMCVVCVCMYMYVCSVCAYVNTCSLYIPLKGRYIAICSIGCHVIYERKMIFDIFSGPIRPVEVQ